MVCVHIFWVFLRNPESELLVMNVLKQRRRACAYIARIINAATSLLQSFYRFMFDKYTHYHKSI